METQPLPDLPDAVWARIPDGARFEVIKDKPRVTVYRIEHPTGALYLKRALNGQLGNEPTMCMHLFRCGMGPEVLGDWPSGPDHYLLTRALPGRDALAFLDTPSALVRILADAMRRLHALPPEGCLVRNTGEMMLDRAMRNGRNGRVDHGLLRFIGFDDEREAYREMCLRSAFPFSQHILHGDFCLPNCILDDEYTVRFVDLGYGGVGDRHYDLFWMVWSLSYNLTDHYAQEFLSAYGRDRVDMDGLRLFALISAFNGYRGRDYYD